MILQITEKLCAYMNSPLDFKVLPLNPFGAKEPPSALVYLQTITDDAKMARMVNQPLMQLWIDSSEHAKPSWETIVRKISANGKQIPVNEPDLAAGLYSGMCLILVEGFPKAIAIDVSHWKDRAISTPENEHSLIGPKDAFIESLSANLSMIRRRIKDHDLVVETYHVGSKSQTKVALLYMKRLVDQSILAQVQQSMNKFDIEILLDTTQIAHTVLKKRSWFTPFPTFQTSERPDKAVSAMMEGRLVLIADSTPTVVLLPTTLISLIQTADDYYFPVPSGTMLRLIRFMGLLITLFLPGLYVSLTSVNQDILRIQFMLAIAASREGVPYPAYVEVLIMMALMELINEATVRLPKVIGGTATIVGGLIIGTSAAQSHLISNIMIVVTAAIAIGSYTIPNYQLGIAFRICGYLLMFLAVPWGLYGMTYGTVFLLLYMCHLKSLGIPYLAPFSTLQWRELFRDSILRLPVTMRKYHSTTYKRAAKTKKRLNRREKEDLL